MLFGLLWTELQVAEGMGSALGSKAEGGGQRPEHVCVQRKLCSGKGCVCFPARSPPVPPRPWLI